MSSVAVKLNAAMEALKIEVANLEQEIGRLQTIKATIRVNAMRHGASDEQIERFLDGRENFIEWIAKAIERNQSN